MNAGFKRKSVSTAILMLLALATIGILPGGKPVRVEARSSTPATQNTEMSWTTSPDWILKLSTLNAMRLHQSIFEQVINSEAAALEKIVQFPSAIRLLETGNRMFPRNSIIAYQLGLDFCVIDPSRAAQYFALAGELDSRYQPLSDSISTDLANFPKMGTLQSLAISKSLIRAGEWQTALEILKNITNSKPVNVDAWILLGQAREKLGLDGFDAYQVALKLEPRSIPARASLAEYYAKIGDRSRAMRIYTDLNKEDPTNPAWDVELGSLYSLSGDLITAYSFYVDAIDSDPQNVNYWIAMINFCAQYQIYIEQVGLPAARKAISLAPRNADAFAGMGELLLLQGDADSAAKFFQAAVDINPQNDVYQYYLGQTYLRSQRMADAYQVLENVFRSEGISTLGLGARSLLIKYFPVNHQ